MGNWKVCIKEPFVNCKHIYPIQQKKVKSMLDVLEKSNNVNKVIVFGSSTENRCHIWSDVDIYADLKENEHFDFDVNFDYDFWTNFKVDDNLKHEILKTGVVVYER